jgi:hypothetical protein
MSTHSSTFHKYSTLPSSSTIYIQQQKCDGRINGREYQRIIQYQHYYNKYCYSYVNTLRSKRNLLWKPSSHIAIRPSTSTIGTRYDNTITTCMDLFSNDNTDQFLITGNPRGIVSIYNLWDPLIASTQQSTRITNTSSSFLHHRVQQRLQRKVLHQFNPIQETTYTTPNGSQSTITALQWYPMDTGSFITSSISGFVTLWDTNNMIPVLNCQPYQYVDTSSTTNVSNNSNRGNIRFTSSNRSRTMTGASTNNDNNSKNNYSIATIHIGIHHPYLVASGAHQSDLTKIIDLRSSGTSHTLMVGTSTSFMHHTTHSNPSTNRSRFVTSVQWSPLQSNILATCTSGNAYIWDIRHTIQPILICNDDQYYKQYQQQKSLGMDTNVSPACRSMDSWLRRMTTTNPIDQQKVQHSTLLKTTKHQHTTGSATSSLKRRMYHLKYDSTGQYLITVGRQLLSSHGSDTSLSVYDLLSYTGTTNKNQPLSKANVPIYPKPVVRYVFTSSNHSISTSHSSYSTPPVLLLPNLSNPQEEMIWISKTTSNGQNELHAYPLLGDKSLLVQQQEQQSYDRPTDQVLLNHNVGGNDYDDVLDKLCGHMGRIRCGVILHGPNSIRQRRQHTDRSNHFIDPYNIITAAEDGVILVWEQHHQTMNNSDNDNGKDYNDDNNPGRRTNNNGNKRPRSSNGYYDMW